MIVVKHTISTKEVIKVDYPGIWPNPIQGLDKDLEYYEIEQKPPLPYNPNQYKLKETITLTKNKGKVYNIAILDWELIEIPKENVIISFNKIFGDWIDAIYPPYKRTNDASIEPSDEGNKRLSRYIELRAERKNRENEYINNNIFPSFDWEF